MDQPTSPTLTVNPSQIQALLKNDIVLVTVEKVRVVSTDPITSSKPERRIEAHHHVFVVEINSGNEGLWHEEFTDDKELRAFIRGARAACFPREFKVLPREWEATLL